MASIPLTSLFSVETVVSIFAKGLSVAQAAGLPVTSWAVDDPTRSLYAYLAEVLAARENIQSTYIKSGFLDDATGSWLTILAKQVYNVDRIEATQPAGEIMLENASASLFYNFDAGDLVFQNSYTSKTYRSTTALSLAPGTTGTVEYIADEAGSDSSAATDEIDTLITSFNGLTILSSTASVGIDEQSDEALRESCRGSLGALSPNGPADAYRYVALNTTLTGNTEPTRAVVTGDNDTGDVTVYVAGVAGPVSAGAITAVSDAIAEWATPVCITPSILNATAVPVPFAMTVYMRSAVGESPSAIQAAIRDKLAELVATIPIGGNDGFLHRWLVEATVRDTYPAYIYNTTFVSPVADVPLADGEVPTVDGTPTVTVVFL